MTKLEQTHDVHLSLEEKFSRGKEDYAHLLEQHKLVVEQLDQEAKLKTELQLKLHKAEGGRHALVCFMLYFTQRALSSCLSFSGLSFFLALNTSTLFGAMCSGLVDGYMADKAALEESLQQKEALEERLVEELEDLKVKLHQMQGMAAELESLRAKHQELGEEHAVVLRQKEHLSAGLGEREKGEQCRTSNKTYKFPICL